MTDTVPADIFIRVIAVAVTALSIAVIIGMYFVVKTVQEVRRVVHTIQQEVSNLIIKRRKMEVYSLTFQKALSALLKGRLLLNKRRSRLDE